MCLNFISRWVAALFAAYRCQFSLPAIFFSVVSSIVTCWNGTSSTERFCVASCCESLVATRDFEQKFTRRAFSQSFYQLLRFRGFLFLCLSTMSGEALRTAVPFPHESCSSRWVCHSDRAMRLSLPDSGSDTSQLARDWAMSDVALVPINRVMSDAALARLIWRRCSQKSRGRPSTLGCARALGRIRDSFVNVSQVGSHPSRIHKKKENARDAASVDPGEAKHWLKIWCRLSCVAHRILSQKTTDGFSLTL